MTANVTVMDAPMFYYNKHVLLHMKAHVYHSRSETEQYWPSSWQTFLGIVATPFNSALTKAHFPAYFRIDHCQAQFCVLFVCYL